MGDYNHKHTKTKTSIPFDIQEEIIKRLPIKSLIRFRSVSRPWKSFIHSSKFIAGYQQAQRLFVSYDYNTLYHIKYVPVVDDDTYPQRELSLVVPVSAKYKTLVLVGSSQGLFCFYDYDLDNSNTVVIWNPTIRKSVDIVVPNVLDMFPYRTIVGFGVCPRTCAPKLVKIILSYSRDEFESKSSIAWQVEVFAPSSRVWTSLCTNLPRKSIWFTPEQVDIDGFIYWRAFDRFHQERGSWWKNMIMSFDMTGNEFTEIYLPSSLTNKDKIGFNISKLRESLLVVEYEKKLTPEKRVHGVWMMENGNPKSFTKLYTIDSPHGSYIKQVLGFSKSGKPIIVLKKDPSEADSLSVYEPKTKDINNIGILGKEEIFFAISYPETLLLLDTFGANKQRYGDGSSNTGP